MLSGDWKLGANYFRKEFTLNYLMATYSKPQVTMSTKETLTNWLLRFFRNAQAFIFAGK